MSATVKLLLIETSSKLCSVAVSSGDAILSCVEEAGEGYIHGEKLHVFIDEALRQAQVQLSELSAVAVSRGPGSYTGLRIGVSAAKGLCYALNIPLISVSALETIRDKAITDVHPDANDRIIAILDARRMEVYSAIYAGNGDTLREVEAEIVDDNSWTEYANNRLFIAGDATDKLRELWSDDNRILLAQEYPSARFMMAEATRRYTAQQFEDVAYFEPFYLKEFVAGIKKNPLGL